MALDLGQIDEAEKEVIRRVINEDLKFTDQTMCYLEDIISESKESALSNSSKECFCKKEKYNPFSTMFLAPQCYQCDVLLCKHCICPLKKHILCSSCHREWFFQVLNSVTPPPNNLSVLINASLAAEKITAVEKFKENKRIAASKAHSTGVSTKQNGSFSRHIYPLMDFTMIKDGIIDTTAEISNEDNFAEVSSLYSEACYDSSYTISGKVEFRLWYNESQGLLYLDIRRAFNLASKGKKINPYVKVNLLPDNSKHNKRKTAIQRGVVNPEYNEIFKYKLLNVKLKLTTLWLSLWSWKMSGRNIFLGELHLPLSDVDLTSSIPWIYDLHNMNQEEEKDATDNPFPYGMLRTQLKFEPESSEERLLRKKKTTSGKIFVRIESAKGLHNVYYFGDTNPFVRCFLLPDTSQHGKRKTKVILGTQDPVWEEEFHYDAVTSELLSMDYVLELSVWDCDRKGVNSFIGGIRLGSHTYHKSTGKEDWMDSSEEEAGHWNQMLAQPGQWVECQHVLRTSMTSLKSASSELPPSSPLPPTLSPILLPPLPPSGALIAEEFKCNRQEETTFTKPQELVLYRRKKGQHYNISGEVSVGLKYDGRTLKVKIIKASNLAKVHRGGEGLDSYVKIYLLPLYKGSLKKTQVQQSNLNPEFGEVFQFPVADLDQLLETTLWISVWSKENSGVDQFLGEKCVTLESCDLTNSTETYQLQNYAFYSRIFSPTSTEKKRTVYRVEVENRLLDTSSTVILSDSEVDCVSITKTNESLELLSDSNHEEMLYDACSLSIDDESEVESPEATVSTSSSLMVLNEPKFKLPLSSASVESVSSPTSKARKAQKRFKFIRKPFGKQRFPKLRREGVTSDTALPIKDSSKDIGVEILLEKDDTQRDIGVEILLEKDDTQRDAVTMEKETP